jgi:hypothetical protein
MWIGETFTSDAGWDHLERLVDLDTRMAGSDGERRAAVATRDALERVGAQDAWIDDFPVQGWKRGTSAIETGDEGRGWGHTHADTLDKLDVRDLRESAIVLTECVVRVAGEAFDCERVDRRQVADALEAEGQARGLRVTGDWPFDDE